MTLKEVMNTFEAAAFLGISPHDLRRYARRGMIPARKLGKRWLFHKPHLVEWLKGEPTRTEIAKGYKSR